MQTLHPTSVKVHINADGAVSRRGFLRRSTGAVATMAGLHMLQYHVTSPTAVTDASSVNDSAGSASGK